MCKPGSAALSHQFLSKNLFQPKILINSLAVNPEPSQSQLLSATQVDHELIAGAMESVHRLFNCNSPADAAEQFVNIQRLIAEKIPAHFAYEETHVFPSLLASHPSDNVAHAIAELCQEHASLLAAGQRLRPLLAQQSPLNYNGELWPVLLEFFSGLFTHTTKEDHLYKLLS